MNSPNYGSDQRIYAFDNLRAAMMLLGLVLHVALTYGTIDYKESWTIKDTNNHLFFDLIAAYIHFFRMPVFFVVAGYFCALLYFKKGANEMLANRIKRILLPLTAGVIVIYPFTLFASHYATYALNGVTDPAKKSLGYIVSDAHTPIGLAHLWFLYFLFIYICASWILGKLTFPTNLLNIFFKNTLKSPILRILFLSIGILLSLLWMDSTYIETSLEWIPIYSVLAVYFIFYGIGWMIFKTNSLYYLSNFSYQQIGLGTIFFFTVIVMGQSISQLLSQLIVCLSISLLVFGFVALFLNYFNTYSGKITYVTEASYFIYIVHLPVVCFIPGLIAGVGLSPFLKFTISLAVSSVICFSLYHFFVRKTFVGLFLNGKIHK